MIRNFSKTDLIPCEKIIEEWADDNTLSSIIIRNLLLTETNTFVYYENNKILGFLNLINNEINALYINKKYQRQGIGTKLIEQATEEIKLNGYYEIKVSCMEYTSPFYTKCGFKVDNIEESGHIRLDDINKEGNMMMHLSKNLDPSGKREFEKEIIEYLKTRYKYVYGEMKHNHLDGLIQGNNNRKPDLIATGRILDDDLSEYERTLLIETKSPGEYLNNQWFHLDEEEKFVKLRRKCANLALKEGKDVAGWIIVIGGQLRDYAHTYDKLKIETKEDGIKKIRKVNNVISYKSTPALAFPKELTKDLSCASNKLGLEYKIIKNITNDASLITFNLEQLKKIEPEKIKF